VERRFRLSLWGIIGLGVVVATVIAAFSRGDPYDMESFRLVRDALGHGALDVYSTFAHRGVIRWPYPPALFPWIYVAGRAAAFGGPSFEFMVRMPTILADAGIAWIVQDFLGRSGKGPQLRLLAAALVSMGPAFLVIAGYHGQFDALAILPATLAVSLWSRTDAPPWRAVAVGLLIGLGGALKTVPLLLVLALLPTTRSKREGVTLLLAAALPVVLCFLPFAIAGTLPAARVLSYRGLPGVGDLSLAAQPDLAELALAFGSPRASGLTQLLIAHGNLVVALGLLSVIGVGARTRSPAPQMAVLLWLAVYAFGLNFFFQYLVWGLPFFLMAGYVRPVLIVQLVLILPTLLFYLRPWHQMIVVVVYATLMITLWVVALSGFLVLAVRLRHHRAAAGAYQS